jgi:hypothetical protein
MNDKSPIYTLPCASTSFEGDTGLYDDIIKFSFFRERQLITCGIKFTKILATRTRAERCCSAWHIEGAYDTLCKIENSTWLDEIKKDTQRYWVDQWSINHYMIYIDSAGCFEILAESWQAVDC